MGNILDLISPKAQILPKGWEPRIIAKTLKQVEDWGLKMVGVKEAWKESRGSGINVFILDSGRPIGHTDLEPNIKSAHGMPINIVMRKLLKSNDIYDYHGHSSFIAGIIGAIDNDIGVVGIAPEVNLHFIKVLGDSGAGSTNGIAHGIRMAVDLNADIVNLSLGGAGGKSLENAISYACDKQVIVCAAAGNDGESMKEDTMEYPAKYALEYPIFPVAALSEDQTRASFSSFGRSLIYGFSMPGDLVYSTGLDNTYTVSSGTSFSCPSLVGVIALLLSYHKDGEHLTPIRPSNRIFDVRMHLIRRRKALGEGVLNERYGGGIILLSGGLD